ncbi:arylsulfatase, partial [Akkermansiaceae bacterium]|nr:arylsulfatase [Akkermansiaceae bacterium]
LYDLEKDPSEKTNLYLKKPKVVKMLLTHLEEDVARGRTTDGPPSANDFPDIKLWKSEKSPPKKK